MSDDPTRRLPPTRGPYPPEYDEAAWIEELRGRIRSFTSALVLVGILAALALGVGIWALLTADEDSGSRGASATRVRDLEDRLKELEDDLDRTAPRSDIADLEKQVQDLDDRVKAIEDRSDQAQQGPSNEDFQTLQDDLQELQQRVDDLEQQQGGGATP